MIIGIHHTSISTTNLARLVSFYEAVLGFAVVYRGGWEKGTVRIDRIVGLHDSAAKYVMLSAGNCYIEMFEYAAPRGKAPDPHRPVCDAGITHICLSVKDIDGEYARLCAAGMVFHAPPGTGEVRATYGRDPDGNIVELLEISNPAHPYQFTDLQRAAGARTRP